MPLAPHDERYLVHRIGWLRTAVLGANDGMVSTLSLIVGVDAAGAGRSEVLVAGLAGPCYACRPRRGGGALRVLVWGALAMAATAAVGLLFGMVTG